MAHGTHVTVLHQDTNLQVPLLSWREVLLGGLCVVDLIAAMTHGTMQPALYKLQPVMRQ